MSIKDCVERSEGEGGSVTSLSSPESAGEPPFYDSASRPAPFWGEILDVWRYRDLVVQLVRRDIASRYKRSFLGVAWTMLNPLMMMVILTLVFSQLFRFDLPHYSVVTVR